MTYRIFSIKHRSPIKHWPRKNAGSKLLIFKYSVMMPGVFNPSPDKVTALVTSKYNLMNSTALKYKVQNVVLVF